jgi:hypothetical protein
VLAHTALVLALLAAVLAATLVVVVLVVHRISPDRRFAAARWRNGNCLAAVPCPVNI